MSDHDIVFANINTKLKANKKNPRLVYLFSKGVSNSIKRDISNLVNEFKQLK